MPTDENKRNSHKTSKNGMSFVDTLHVLRCLMSVETCFLTICNDLERRFWLKNLHFLGF